MVQFSNLGEIYDELAQRGLTTSKSQFSRDWLSMSYSYYTMVGRESHPYAALTNLWRRLDEERLDDLARAVGRLLFHAVPKRITHSDRKATCAA